MTIGEKIRLVRKERNMTQEELGISIGMQKAAINKYETGIVVNLKRDVIAKLAKVLDVNPVWLIDESVGWPPAPLTNTEDEIKLVEAWREAEPWQREAVKKLLNMKE